MPERRKERERPEPESKPVASPPPPPPFAAAAAWLEREPAVRPDRQKCLETLGHGDAWQD